jgi:catechol 2,3-dioxygenase-like lactoylglutathione lyase family enzyme
LIKVKDIAYVVYAVPDLNVMERFLVDFGLQTTLRTADSLYMRTANGMPYQYVARLADKNGFIAFGMLADSYSDLEKLAAHNFGIIEPIEAPGGGSQVVLTSPDGYRFEVVYGIGPLSEGTVRDPLVYNFGAIKNRSNDSQRPPKGRVDALRLGHCAFTSLNPIVTIEWLQQTMGIKVADYLVSTENESVILGAFLRCDQGETLVDHHTLFCSLSNNIHIHHCSFEVQDIDAVMSGHDFLLKQGYELEVGVGRHMAGSQVFDYWLDPFGMRIEHYADGDVVNNAYVSKNISGTPEGVTQWGPVPPDKFFE